MPFFTTGTIAPPPPITLRVLERDKFQLMEGFSYRSKAGDTYNVPAHTGTATTDLASVPSPLWGLLASYGRQLRAALLHDCLCDRVDVLASLARNKEAKQQRRIADNLFREAMRERVNESKDATANRVPWFRSWLFWAGVSFGRYLEFAQVRVAILILQVLAGVAAVAGMTGVFPVPTDLPERLQHPFMAYGLVYVILLILSVAWWRDARLALIGVLVGPILVPVIVVTFLARLILAVPDAILHLIHPSKEPKSVIKSTIVFKP